MFFFSFVARTFSVLRHGDNPYAILGLPPNALQEEIEAAYQRLLNQLQTDSKEIFERITDAYEILKNEERKYLFDHYRIVSEGKIKTTREKATDFVSKIRKKGLSDIFFHDYDLNPVDYKTPLYLFQYPEKLLQYTDCCFVLAYSENAQNYSYDYGRAFESAYTEFSPYFSFWRISHEECGPWFFEKFKITSLPCVCFMKRNSKNQIVVKKIYRTADTEMLKKWITNLTPHHILKMGDVEEAANWVKNEPYATHIISFAFDESPPFFLRALSHAYPTIRFAYLRNETTLPKSKWNYTMFPTTLIFRGGKSIEYRANTSVWQYSGYFYSPFVWKLMWEGGSFLLYCGTKKEPYSYTRNVTITDPSSIFAKLLKLKEGDWKYIDPDNWLMYDIDSDGNPVGNAYKMPFIGGLIAALSSGHIMTSGSQLKLSIATVIIAFIINYILRG